MSNLKFLCFPTDQLAQRHIMQPAFFVAANQPWQSLVTRSIAEGARRPVSVAVADDLRSNIDGHNIITVDLSLRALVVLGGVLQFNGVLVIADFHFGFRYGALLDHVFILQTRTFENYLRADKRKQSQRSERTYFEDRNVCLR